jgi:hypothetical protein
MRFEGRALVESENDQKYCSLTRRYSVGLSSNRVWLYTVDVSMDLRSDKPIVRMRRWRARGTGRRAEWRPTRAYNVRSKEQWDRAAPLVESCLLELGGMADPRFLAVFSRLDRLASDTTSKVDTTTDTPSVDDLERELVHAKSERRLAERRYAELRQHAKTYKHVLSTLQELIDDSDTGETAVHNFIMDRNARWLFGLEYSSLNKEVWFPPKKREFRFDFMLQRFDGFSDLVELKSPNVRLFHKEGRGKRSRLSRQLSGALGQVVAYLNACSQYQSKDLFRPKAFIVIGKTETDNPEQRRLLQSHLTQVEILTYSSLIERGKSLLEHISGRPIRARKGPSSTPPTQPLGAAGGGDQEAGL